MAARSTPCLVEVSRLRYGQKSPVEGRNIVGCVRFFKSNTCIPSFLPWYNLSFAASLGIPAHVPLYFPLLQVGARCHGAEGFWISVCDETYGHSLNQVSRERVRAIKRRGILFVHVDILFPCTSCIGSY